MKRSTRGAVAPFLVMEMLGEANSLAADGKQMLHLSLGQPGDRPPQRVLDRAAELLKTSDPLGYTESAGVPLLRERISQFYKQRYGVDVPVSRIFITVGSSSAFFLSLLSAFDQGDQVALTLPGYAAYPNMLEAVDLIPQFLRCGEETKFQPTIAMLDALPSAPAGLILASPANPTGTMIDNVTLKNLAEHAKRKGIRIISDEVYHGITYGQKAQTILAYSQDAIVVNSFSKYFLMPGWRLGWAVVPEDLTQSFERLLQNFFISPPTLAQHAAAAVFDCQDELDEVVKRYAVNRSILLEELPKAGIDQFLTPEGAFYLYANISRFTNDSVSFCRKMMHETGVVAVSGQDFDRENGNAYIRFSFCGREDTIREAMKRLQEWMAA